MILLREGGHAGIATSLGSQPEKNTRFLGAVGWRREESLKQRRGLYAHACSGKVLGHVWPTPILQVSLKSSQVGWEINTSLDSSKSQTVRLYFGKIKLNYTFQTFPKYTLDPFFGPKG